MKKIKLNILVAIACILCGVNVYAYDFEVDGIYYNIISVEDLSCEVTFNDVSTEEKYTGNIVIPSVINYNKKDLYVKKIGDRAFGGCDNMLNITIPESIDSIGDNAFSGCSSLKKVSIPNSVIFIGEGAFYKCTGLMDVAIGTGLSKIGRATFQECINLSSVIIPTGVMSIGPDAFTNCYALKEVSFSDDVVSIGNRAFSGCKNLKDLLFPVSLKKIGDDAFYGCLSITSLIIPKNVILIGERAFYNCENLKDIIIQDTEEALEIENDYIIKWNENGSFYYLLGAFIGCPIETVYMGRDLMPYETSQSGNHTTAYGSPFSNLDKLSNFVIGDKVKIIGEYLFYNLKSLKSISIPANVDTIEQYAFNNCGIKRILFEESNKPLYIMPNYVKYDDVYEYIYISGEESNGGPHGYFDGYTNCSCKKIFDSSIEQVYLGRPLIHILPRNTTFKKYKGTKYEENWVCLYKYDPECLDNIHDLFVNIDSIPFSKEGIASLSDDITIVCKSETPPKVAPFNNTTYLNAVLYVPTKSLDIYQKHDVWKNFFNITVVEDMSDAGMQVSNPCISIDKRNVNIACKTDNAIIYYTKDGSMPSIYSTRYEEPFKLNENTVVKAVAMKELSFDSDVEASVALDINNIEFELESDVIKYDGMVYTPQFKVVGEVDSLIICKNLRVYNADNNRPVNVDSIINVGNYKYKLEIDNDSIYANSQFNLIIEKANPNLIWEQNVGIMDVGQKLKLCYSTDYGNVRLTVEDPSIVTCSRNQVSEEIYIEALNTGITDVTLSLEPSDNYYPKSITKTVKVQPSALYETEIKDVLIYKNDNSIIISNLLCNTNVSVYDIYGKLVYSGTDVVIPINTRGIYIVKLNNNLYKINI